ncbi:MAG: adenosylcobinamide-phosphate synthase CbiB [Pseudomonadota bacterium]
MTTALVLLCALLLDALIGEPHWLWSRLPHPAVLMGRLVGALDQRLNVGASGKVRGILCVLVLISAGYLTGAAVSSLGPVAEVLVAAILLAQRSLVQHVAAVAKGLATSLPAGRKAVAMIVSRDTAQMDRSQVARAAIESAAENLSDGVIAPAFWLLIGGLPGLVIYKMVNTADSMIGYRTPKYEAFGWAAARLDDALNLIPARATALVIMLVSRTGQFGDIRSDARLHRSPNAGWPEAAMARALGIALSGPRAYDGTLRDFPWVNPDGRRDLTEVDIDAANVMLWKTWAAVVCLCALTALLTA